MVSKTLGEAHAGGLRLHRLQLWHAGSLRLQRGRQVRVDPTRWVSTELVLVELAWEPSGLRWQRRKLLRCPGIGKWALLHLLAVHHLLLHELILAETRRLRLHSSLHGIHPGPGLLLWVTSHLGLHLHLILLLEPLLVEIVQALSWRGDLSGDVRCQWGRAECAWLG